MKCDKLITPERTKNIFIYIRVHQEPIYIYTLFSLSLHVTFPKNCDRKQLTNASNILSTHKERCEHIYDREN